MSGLGDPVNGSVSRLRKRWRNNELRDNGFISDVREPINGYVSLFFSTGHHGPYPVR